MGTAQGVTGTFTSQGDEKKSFTWADHYVTKDFSDIRKLTSSCQNLNEKLPSLPAVHPTIRGGPKCCFCETC